MCGIVGYIGDGLGEALLDLLLGSMRSRGPDGDGRHHDGPIHMGMRRLSIIDLSEGWQPLRSREGKVVAFQNGEIYNYRLLRSELEAAGFAFHTNSDTEILAHGYAQWGIDGLLRRLDGMYAIAIKDADRGELHLARDRFGEKPLFFAASRGRFGYGSTLLSVSSLPWVSDEIDKIALDRYFACHFVPGDRTVFADVRQLLPGERLTVRLDTLDIVRARNFLPRHPRPRHVPDQELAKALEHAVTSRLIADVPVGVFLSGGLDSSLVAALAARANPGIATFSMGFSEAHVDESAHAAAVARHVGSTHHTFIFDQSHFGTLVPEVAAALDTPIGDQALLPVYWLAREASRHAKVVLTGEGADEVFAGYGYYRQFIQPPRWRDRLSGLRGLLSTRRLQTVPSMQFLGDDPPVTPSGFPLLTERAERESLLDQAPLAADLWEQEALDWLGGAHSPLQRATAADVVSWLPNDLLVKLDRMSMAHGLEGRAPFLEPQLVELGLTLSPEQRMAQTSKVALRRVARRYLPDHILERPKQGFVLPMRSWLNEWFTGWGGCERYFCQRPFPTLNDTALSRIIEDDLAAGLKRERLLFAVVMLREWWYAFSNQRAELRRRAPDMVPHPA